MNGVPTDLPQVFDKLTLLLREVFLRDDIIATPELSAEDVPGWDSFKQIEIIISIEETYGIKFQTRDLDSLYNIGDLARTIVAKSGK